MKKVLNNPNLNLVNIVVYTKSGEVMSIGSQDVERKENSDINQGSYLKGLSFVTNLRKMMRNNAHLGFVNISVCTKFCHSLSIGSDDIK